MREWCSEELSVERHVEFTEWEEVLKLFDVKNEERALENGVLKAIYSRLALKGL